MSFTVALAGNPNSGKTTLFNALTGSSQYVGNWPGVTVEKKEGKLRQSRDVTVVDLPGIYSLSPYSPEEIISRDFIIKGKPDLIINIIDAANLERNLYLTLQLLETDVPVIIALNMIDVLIKRGESVDAGKLSSALGAAVIEISASKGKGIDGLVKAVLKIKEGGAQPKKHPVYNIDFAVNKAVNLLGGDGGNKKWLAVKLLENDELIKNSLNLTAGRENALRKIINELERAFGDDCDSVIAGARYSYIDGVLKGAYHKKPAAVTATEKIDRVATNRYLALPLFFVILWAVYYISVQLVGGVTSRALNDFFKSFSRNADGYLSGIGAPPWLKGLVCEGIISGVGAVLVFVPQLMALFLLLSFLEDSGYMARIAFIMDRVFKQFGLSGKSFIPMLIGTGCTVPAVTAARTIEDENRRKMTVILTPFIPCGAKLPVFALIAAAVFPGYSFVAPSMYFVGIFAAISGGLILKNTPLFKGKEAPFVMELPEYRMPRPKGLLIHMWVRCKDFLIKAGTVIFTASCLIWLLANFNWSFEAVDVSRSMLASIGKFIAPLFKPLGFGNWQCAVAVLSGYAAKENIVATLGIILNRQSGGEFSLSVAGLFDNPAAAYGFMVFTLLAPPCFAALSVIRRELGAAKWFLFALLFQTGVSYSAAFMIFQIGSLLLYKATAYTPLLFTLPIAAIVIYTGVKMLKRKSCCNRCNGCGQCARVRTIDN